MSGYVVSAGREGSFIQVFYLIKCLPVVGSHSEELSAKVDNITGAKSKEAQSLLCILGVDT